MISGLSVSLSGLQAASSRIQNTANNISNAFNTPLQDQDKDVDLAKELTELKVDEVAYKANLTMVKVQDDMMKTTMNLLA